MFITSPFVKIVSILSVYGMILTLYSHRNIVAFKESFSRPAAKRHYENRGRSPGIKSQVNRSWFLKAYKNWYGSLKVLYSTNSQVKMSEKLKSHSLNISSCIQYNLVKVNGHLDTKISQSWPSIKKIPCKMLIWWAKTSKDEQNMYFKPFCDLNISSSIQYSFFRCDRRLGHIH